MKPSKEPFDRYRNNASLSSSLEPFSHQRHEPENGKDARKEEMSLDLLAVNFSKNEAHIDHPYLEGHS